jgi:hypothetical protein
MFLLQEYIGTNAVISKQYTTPSTQQLQDALKLTTSLHQVSLRTDLTILNKKNLIITHFNLHLYYLFNLTEIIKILIVI